MICFIVNPAAGKGKAVKVMRMLAARLNRDRVPHDIRYTAESGHATQIARQAVADGYRTVVSVGGDGTVNETAAGLPGSGADLGIIPGGSGNDYRRCLGIPVDPMAALDVILAGHRRPVDALDINGRLFMNIANVGFDNDVAANAGKYKRFGRLAYLLAVFDTLRKHNARQMRFTIDGVTREQPILLMDVGCGTHLGGGMHALPGADPFDGWMDACFVDDVSPMTIVRLLPKYMMGRHMRLPICHRVRCRQVTLECLDGPLSVGGDGEQMDASAKATIRVVPGVLSIFTPLGESL